MGGLGSRGPAICRALTQLVEGIPGQGTLEGCHIIFWKAYYQCMNK